MSVSVSCLHQYVVFVDGRGPFRCPEMKFDFFMIEADDNVKEA